MLANCYSLKHETLLYRTTDLIVFSINTWLHMNKKHLRIYYCKAKEKNIPTISVLTCARDGTLKIP